jgi:hypothetical protein
MTNAANLGRDRIIAMLSELGAKDVLRGPQGINRLGGLEVIAAFGVFAASISVDWPVRWASAATRAGATALIAVFDFAWRYREVEPASWRRLISPFTGGCFLSALSGQGDPQVRLLHPNPLGCSGLRQLFHDPATPPNAAWKINPREFRVGPYGVSHGGCNRPLMVVPVTQGFHHVIPDFIGPVDRPVGRLEDKAKGLALQDSIIRMNIVHMFSDSFVHRSFLGRENGP